MSLHSPLKKARGLGSAKEGAHHWWMQRVTAIALVPLTIWMLSCLGCLLNGDYLRLREWIAQPFVTIVLSLFVITSFYHASLGVQTIIEDYIHNKVVKNAALLAVKYSLFAAGFISLYAILKINFTPALPALGL